jgi:epsilon-lactone hydrolase
MGDKDRPALLSRMAPPMSISETARELLSAPFFPPAVYPDADDSGAWRRHVADLNAQLATLFSNIGPIDDIAVGRDTIDGVPVYTAIPRGADEARLLCDIHGGALIYMGGDMVATTAALAAARTGFAVVSPDYRMPPDHRYPAALDDCVAVYRRLAERIGPSNIVVSGTSAGGNLAAATMLRAG